MCITCIMQARLFSERVKCACFRFRARFPQVPGRLNLRHDLRAWSSLRLGPKLPRRAVPDGLAGEIDWLRVDPARDSLFCFQPFLLFLILSLFVCLAFLLACSTFFLPTTSTSLHFVQTSQPFTHHSGSLYKLASHHFTTIYVTELS